MSRITFSLICLVSVFLLAPAALAGNGQSGSGNGQGGQSVPSLPESPAAMAINPCEQFDFSDLAGQVASQKHDGKRFHFNPANMIWDPAREIWYENQGGSTWECIMNSNPSADANLVYDFSYRRSGASSGDLVGRLDFGTAFLNDLANTVAQEACYVCGLIRHKKGCFPPGVEVLLGDGESTKKVEELAVGDELWNPLERRSAKILRVIEGPETKPLLQISAGDLQLTVTEEHPIYTPSGMKQAKSISTADVILDRDSAPHQVESVEKLPVKDGQTVINFVLERAEDAESVLVADGVLVGDLETQQKLASRP